jgi:glycosyltransferase involved in cell wall biosynthesis
MEQFLLILLIVFILTATIQIIYYLIIFGKFSFSKSQTGALKQVPVSVIVCAKNEQENLKKNIPLLLQQNYSNYEIVIIDDASSDDTLAIIEEFEKANPTKIKVVKVKNNEAFWGNKKFALTLGIKSANKEYLLLTDADCYPTSDNWISEMSASFTEEKTIVLGYGAYEKMEGSFLNKIIRFETLLTAIQYFSWAKLGRPYMGVGRNLAYKKDEFYKANGFVTHMKIRSGDDDLFINEASTKYNTTINFNADSITYSEAKTSLQEWILQKRRHVSTAKYYKAFDKFQLGLFYTSQLLFLILAIVLLSFQFEWIIVLSVVLTRYIASWITIYKSAIKLEEKDLVIYFPFIEILLIFIQLHIFIKNSVTRQPQWK